MAFPRLRTDMADARSEQADARSEQAAVDRLADGGTIEMPWAQTFWSAGFGTLTDRFGIKWMIGCDEVPAG